MRAHRFTQQMARNRARRVTHAVTQRQRERTAALVERAAAAGSARRPRTTDPVTGKIGFIWGLSGLTQREIDLDAWRML